MQISHEMISKRISSTSYLSPVSVNLREGPLLDLIESDKFHLSEIFLSKYENKQPKWGPVGYPTFKRTYARHKYGDKNNKNKITGNESFVDNCKRTIEGVFTLYIWHCRKNNLQFNLEVLNQRAERMFELMFKFNWLPPGRGMWMMGTDYLYSNSGSALQNCLFVSTKDIHTNFANPFVTLMDFSMLGVGCGFDTRGKNLVTIQEPIKSDDIHVVPDTRLGWVSVYERFLHAFVGLDTLPKEVDFSQIRREGVPIKGFGGTSSGPEPLKELLTFVKNLLSSYVGRKLDSTGITDLMNLTGKCVVSGNVRRSSEIAIGDFDDSEFKNLKDITGVVSYRQKLAEIELKNEDYLFFDSVIKQKRSELNNINSSDEMYVEVQKEINEITKAQTAILMQDEEYAALYKEYISHPLMHHRWASNNSIFGDKLSYLQCKEIGYQNATGKDLGILFLETMRNYGRLIDPPNFLDLKVLGVNPCTEQTLEHNECCTLVEMFPTLASSLKDFLEVCEYAFFYGKIVTLVPIHNEEVNRIVNKNRRIGCSMAGLMPLYKTLGEQKFIEWLDTSYKHIKEYDKKLSKELNICESIKVTSIKPGGTVPLLPGIEGGMKLAESEYFFRTIRFDRISPAIPVLEKAGYRIEDDLTTPRTKVVYFPMKANENDILVQDVDAEFQLKICSLLQTYYSDNAVSCTIVFKNEEKDRLGDLIWNYKDKIKNASFLEYSNHGYAQAPYIAINKETYEKYVSKLKPYSLENLELHEVEEKFCDGLTCTVKN